MKRLESGILRCALAVACILCITLIDRVKASDPPHYTDSYRGDSNGDFIVDLIDVNAAKDLTLLRCVDHSDVVPSDTCKGDTHDLNGDGVVDLLDLNIHKEMSLLRPYTSPDLPWTLDLSGIPASVGGSAPIYVKVQNFLNIGRPGIVVRFSVISGPAELYGREYNPVKDGVREHEAAGVLDMLAVTTTDFPADTTGRTEAVVTGGAQAIALVCTADAPVELEVSVAGNAYKGIPSLTQNKIVNCSAVSACTGITINCPLNVAEIDPLTCIGAYSGTCNLSVGTGNTCTNATVADLGGGSFRYDALAQGEAAGPGSCVAAVADGSISDSNTVIIDDTNGQPGFVGLPATVTAVNGYPFSFTATKTDADLPAQQLTCSIATIPVPQNNMAAASALGAGDSVSDTPADLSVADASTPINGSVPADGQYGVPRRERMEVTSFDTSSIPGGAVITGVTLNVINGTADNNGSMSNAVQYNGSDTSIIPIPTGGLWSASQTFDLFGAGIIDVASIQSLVIGYTNNTKGGPNNRSMDFDVVNVTVDYIIQSPLDTCGWGTLIDNPGTSGSICTYFGTASGLGTCTVTLKVTDSSGAEKQQDLTIDVREDAIDINCPATNETDPIACAVATALGPGSCAIGPGDTCGGSIDPACAGPYVAPAQGEIAGPGMCVAEVVKGFEVDTDNVSILEVNSAPYIKNLPATITGHWNWWYGIRADANDADIPLQDRSWSLSGNTCSFTQSMNSSAGLVTWRCGDVQTCKVDVTVTDNGAPPLSDTEPLNIRCENDAPVITSIASGSVNEGTNYSYNIICSDIDSLTLGVGGGDTCGGLVVDYGNGTGTYSFMTDETMGGSSCEVEVFCSDTQDTYIQTTPVTVNENTSGIIELFSVNAGILPANPRVNVNYPPENAQIDFTFGNVITDCSLTVTCTDIFGAATVIPGSVSIFGNTCSWSPSAGDLPGRSNCEITDINIAPGCLNCSGSYSFSTAIETSNCAVAQGGTCGGFISNGLCSAYDGENNTGIEDILIIDVISPELGGALIPQLPDRVYVLVEQSQDLDTIDPDDADSVLRIERFAVDGSVTLDASDGLMCRPVKVTAAYKGASGTGVPNQGDTLGLLGEKRQNYQTTVMANVDARHIVVPMRRTTGVLSKTGMAGSGPKLTIWGDIPASGWHTMVGRVPLSNGMPDPIRSAIVTMTIKDMSLSNLNLEDLLLPSKQDSTATICVGVLNQPMGGLRIPANMLIPDLIRQNWLAGCSGGSQSNSPMKTTYSLRTYRQNETGTIMVIGASIRSELFNIFMGLKIMDLPISVTAIGTKSIDIPGYAMDTNLYSEITPLSTPFEYDIRNPAGAGTGTAYPLQGNIIEIPPIDAERAALGGSDPNLSNANFYPLDQGHWTKLSSIFMLGADFGSKGIGMFSLGNLVSIDDGNFTVFARSNAATKVFTNVNPWKNSSTNTGVISADPFNPNMTAMWAPPSTLGDAELDFSSANYAALAGFYRPFIDDHNGGIMAFPISQPGWTMHLEHVGPPESMPALVEHTRFMELPVMTNPASPGYYDSLPQLPDRNAVAGGQPINRNGQIIRGTATVADNTIPLRSVNGMDARYFEFNNPVDSLTGTESSQMYKLSLLTGKKFGNLEPDNREIARNPRFWQENEFITIWGPTSSWVSNTGVFPSAWAPTGPLGSTSVTLPWISPRYATLDGIFDNVPDPYEKQLNAMKGRTEALEWELQAQRISTDPTTGWGQFDWNNFNMSAYYTDVDIGSSEKHQFVMQ